MQKQSRTDRILIFCALFVFLTAGGLFYFDDWMWGGHRNRADRIGEVASRKGDVRMKLEGEVKWQRAARGQDLIYNDSIYAGSGSEAKLQIGQSDMLVTENTLVVLRRDDQVNFMKLAYGSVFGRVAKNEKVIIETGDGKKIEFSPKTESQIVVKKAKSGATTVNVISGEADIKADGKVTHVTQASQVVAEKDRAPNIKDLKLIPIRPIRTDILYSEEPGQIGFEWKWSSGRRPSANQNYVVEFSATPTFEVVKAKREVQGQMTTTVQASESVSLYYRVRGPSGEVSPVEQMNFVRLHEPVIVKPEVNAHFAAPEGGVAAVPFEVRLPAEANLWLQVAQDPEFQKIVVNTNSHDPRELKDLPVGAYFARARAVVAESHVSHWSASVPFVVEKRLSKFSPFTPNPLSRFVIPNESYPKALYSSSPAIVEAYLYSQGMLQAYFPTPHEGFDHLEVEFEKSKGGVQTIELHNRRWPKERLYPIRHKFRYQVVRSGYEALPWSPPLQFEITMEPPKPVGDVKYSVPDKDGVSLAHWSFTPLLYAASYDVELARDPGMHHVSELKVTQPEVNVKLTGDNYWRARARDSHGRIISDFSRPYKVRGPVPQFLAKNERQPAAVDSTSTKVERIQEKPYVKNGWWTWAGVGDDYIDYRQSIPGRGTLIDHRFDGPSEYGEVGFLNHGGWGAVISYKRTPGQVSPSNAYVDDESYTWTTLGAEGELRKDSGFRLFDIPVIYGVRIGIQDQRMPYLFLNSLGTLEMKANEMTNASAGLMAEWSRRRWTYYWLMRYQYPLSTKADGATVFSIAPVFAFDGSIGTSYNLTRQMKLGLFWYGQWHQFKFTYSDGSQTNEGFQSLFYSNLDLRFGYDF